MAETSRDVAEPSTGDSELTGVGLSGTNGPEDTGLLANPVSGRSDALVEVAAVGNERLMTVSD